MATKAFEPKFMKVGVLTAALQEYRGAGTPYGDDFAGFARYLSQGDLPQRPSPTGPAGSH